MYEKIQLTRIDNRLVHGQVGMTWTNSLDVDTIVVIDDTTATSSFAQKLMQSIASAANVTNPIVFILSISIFFICIGLV